MKLLKVIITQWLFTIISVRKIFDKHEKIKKFCKATCASKKFTYLTHKVAKETHELLLNPEIKVMMSFIRSFGEFYWNTFYKWARRKGSETIKEGHFSNEVITRIFNVARQLSSLTQSKWLGVKNFAE